LASLIAQAGRIPLARADDRAQPVNQACNPPAKAQNREPWFSINRKVITKLAAFILSFGRSRKSLLPLLLHLTLPAVVQAQSYTNAYGIWTYTTANGAITIRAYTGTNAMVAIPSTINGLPVTNIGDHAFEYCTGLTAIAKRARATRCRTTGGSTLANLPAGDTRRVSWKSPVRANRTPGSLRGPPGNRCTYLDTTGIDL
jgi:hypothetical protein